VYWAGDQSAREVLAGLRSAPHLLCVVLDGAPTGGDESLHYLQLLAARRAGIPAALWSRGPDVMPDFQEQVRLLLDRSASLPESLSALHERTWHRTGRPAPLVLMWNDPALEELDNPVVAAPDPEPPTDRSRTFAVVVGVEQYADEPHELDLDGPAHDARNITGWLLEQGVPPGNITALLSPAAGNRDVMTDTAIPVREATVDNVMRVLFEETAVRSNVDDLLVFWSGHGFTDAAQSQYLLTADGIDGPFLSLSEVLRAFRTDVARSCRRQFWFIDVCGGPYRFTSHPPPPVGPQVPRGSHVTTHHQSVYLASGLADDAVEIRGLGGLFSLQLVEVLRETAPWDVADPRELHEELTRRFGELRGLGRTRQVPHFEVSGDEPPPLSDR
jgi:hypothetical protein